MRINCPALIEAALILLPIIGGLIAQNTLAAASQLINPVAPSPAMGSSSRNNSPAPSSSELDAFQGVLDQLTSEPPAMKPTMRSARRIAGAPDPDPNPTAMDYMKQAADDYQQTTALTGELETRRAIALQDKQEEVQRFQDLAKNSTTLDPTGALFRGSVLAAQATQREDDEKRAKATFIQNSSERTNDTAARGDQLGATVMQGNLTYGAASQGDTFASSLGEANTNSADNTNYTPVLRLLFWGAILVVGSYLWPSLRRRIKPRSWDAHFCLNPKFILGAAGVLAVALFLLPPINSSLGVRMFFDGWGAIWNLGYDPVLYRRHEIAIPVLLTEWGLLAFCTFALTRILKK